MRAYSPTAYSVVGDSFQGGAPEEHYTLTQAEYEYVVTQVTTGAKLYEPVAINGELVFDNNGDILMDFGGSYAS